MRLARIMNAIYIAALNLISRNPTAPKRLLKLRKIPIGLKIFILTISLLTTWPDRMTSPFTDPAKASLPEKSRAEAMRTSLALLTQMETSLKTSQQALMARDLDGIEQGIRKQTDLQNALALLWSGDGHPREATPALTRGPTREDTRELRAAAARVLHVGRVQVLLLRRAQRSLTTVANLLAGPQASYDPSCRTLFVPATQPSSPGRSKTACPA
jgi:hypothetical protein